MKRTLAVLLMIVSVTTVKAQTTPVADTPSIVVNRDPRLDQLGKKQLEFSNAAASSLRATKGYRLLVLKSNDREYAMKVRSLLLQNYPDQKVYMSFEAPFIKLRFGNFVEKDDAEKFKNQIMRAKFVTNNIYVVPEMVEVKGDKNKDNNDD